MVDLHKNGRRGIISGMGEFFQYLRSFGGYWWAIIPGGVTLGIDAVIVNWFPSAKEWLDKYQEKYRKRLWFAVLLLGVFYAGYAAWQDEYNQVQALTGQQPAFRDLTSEQTACIKKVFTGKQKDFPVILILSVAGEEPEYYANAFVNAFSLAGLNALSGGDAIPTPGHSDDKGVIIGFADPLHPSKEGQEFENLFASCRFKISTETFEDKGGGDPDFDLFIAPEN